MTASVLLSFIVAGLLLQLATGIAISVWRRRTDGRVSRSMALESAQISTAAWAGWREFRIVRREFEDEAHTQCSFYLAPVDGSPLPPYEPGQFLTFSVQSAAECSVIRCYSLSDKPDPDRYRITVKRIPPLTARPEMPGGVCSNHFHDQLHEGDIVKVKAPSGRFCIDSNSDIPAVLIAGGIGITPMISMLQWSLAKKPERDIHLYYGLRDGSQHAFRRRLDELAGTHPRFHLNVAYSRPGPNDLQGRDYHCAGHVDADLIRRTLSHGRHQFYVCGPPAMMESLVPALVQWGVPLHDIHYEAFGPSSALAASSELENRHPTFAAPLDVQLRRSGRTLVWDGQDESLLAFAERHGVAVESGCRSGSCGTCETQLISGVVRYARQPDHEVAPGHCLLCVAKPESSLVLEA